MFSGALFTQESVSKPFTSFGTGAHSNTLRNGRIKNKKTKEQEVQRHGKFENRYTQSDQTFRLVAGC